MTIIKEVSLTLFTIIIIINYSFSQRFELELSGFNQESDVAYLGVNNSIKMKTESLTLETNNGDILHNNNQFVYRPKTLGKAIISSTPKRTTAKKPRTNTCEVTVKYLPFTFELGHTTTFFKNTIHLKKKDLLSANFYMRSTNTNLSATAKILEFTIIVERNNKRIIEKTYSDYDKETRNNVSSLFESLKKNDIITVDKLKYTYLEEHIIENKQVKIVVN